jgi:cyclohexadienyl dehydratase
VADNKKRVRSRALSALAVLTATLAACAAAPHASHTAAPAAPAPSAATAAPLRVGTSGDYPPFSVRAADGSFAGLDVDVATAYARDRGRTLELVPFAWPDLERRLAAGDFDVAMSGVTVRADRLTSGAMTASVVRASAIVVVPAGDTRAFPADGAGRTVAVNRGGHLERTARAHLPRATIVTVDDNRSLPVVLLAGKATPAPGAPSQAVDGVVTDTLEHASFAQHGAPDGRVALVLSGDRKAYWTAPREDALAADLDAWLAARAADGSLDALRARHLGAAATSARPILPPAVARVVDLIGRRLMLMPEVAREKRIAGLPVEVAAREQEVFARAAEEASRAGLAPEAYVALVRAQVEAAKQVQRAVLAQPAPAAPPATADAAPPDADAGAAAARARIDTRLRPAIDRLDRALRAALAAAAPIEQPQAALIAALRADAPVPGFGAAEAGAIAAALRNVPAAAGRRISS